MARDKKDLDFELNLIPFISLLSALICSLLLTATLITMGTLDVKHALGGQSLAETEKVPVLWAQMEDDGGLTLLLKDAEKLPPRKRKSIEKLKLVGVGGETNLQAFEQELVELRNTLPQLQTVLIKPRVNSIYENIIALMDSCKKVGMVDLGIEPL